ncbi:MAG: glycosyltransferase family 2 protein [Deinococcales bacterium]
MMQIEDVESQGCLGYIDGIVDGWLHGWAYNLDNPDIPLDICVVSDNKIVAKGKASKFREDLLKAEFASGYVGFAVLLDSNLFDGEERELHLIEESSGQIISMNSFSFSAKAEARVSVEHIEGWSIKGACELSGPLANQNLRIQTIVDEDRTFSAELQPAGIGNRKQFNFSIPLASDLFDGQAHSFAFKLEGQDAIIGYHVTILAYSQTPWLYLKDSYQHYNYASLSRTAAFRYESLRTQMWHKKKPSELNMVLQAHEIVVQGYEERKRFPALELPYVAKPKVSIIIPVYNKAELTYHCIASQILSFNKASYEIIVIDDVSTDETVRFEEIIKRLKVIHNEENLGFLQNCNKAAEEARGEYLVFLNNDTEVTSGWLDAMLEVFDTFPQAGLIGSKLIYPDGRLQEAGGIVWGNGQPWNLGRLQNPLAPQFNYTRQADYVSGASMMISKKLWKRVSGFSEEFIPAYYEDTDLAYKVRAAGYKVYYCPFSEVVHFEGMSNGTDTGSGIKSFQAVNAPKFRKKWAHTFAKNGTVGQDLHRQMDREHAARILFVDHSIPRPNYDAGSYAALQEIKLIQSLGIKVSFIPENLAHLGRYTEDLQKLGVECFYAPFQTSMLQFLQQYGREFDGIYITRYDVAARHIEAIRHHAPQANVIFNNADLHFLRSLRMLLAEKTKDLSQAIQIRDHELALMRKVDAILSYTEAEHAVILSHNLKSENIFPLPLGFEYQGAKNSP